MRGKRSAALQAELEERLAEVVRSVNERKDHIPPVVSPATVTFPFEIAIAGCVPQTGHALRITCIPITLAFCDRVRSHILMCFCLGKAVPTHQTYLGGSLTQACMLVYLIRFGLCMRLRLICAKPATA